MLLIKHPFLNMRRRTFLTVSNEGIDVSKAMACDICLCNKSTGKLLIVESSKFSATEYPSDKYSPVGVVVIPGSHDVYGDGSCGVMSLKEMSCDTPDTGSTTRYQYIYWGQYGNDISTLTNYNYVCYVGSYGTVNEDVQGVNTSAYLPSDKFSTVQNPYDTDTYFYYNNRYEYIPSPYNEDDTRNPAYYQTASPSSAENALSDFDGVGNTTKLINFATAQTNWKTASTITNKSDRGYSPAACCCWRYHTEGTKQGDWYLPAMGELGYIMPKYNKINQTIETLITAYGSTVGILINKFIYYWSSSECSSYNAQYVVMDNGCVSIHDKREDIYVRAFLRVGV